MGAKPNDGAYSNIHGNKAFGVNWTGITKRTVVYQEDQRKEAALFSTEDLFILNYFICPQSTIYMYLYAHQFNNKIEPSQQNIHYTKVSGRHTIVPDSCRVIGNKVNVSI